MVPSITEKQVLTALGNLLTAILPGKVSVIVGQTNRVASPQGDYVVMWPLRLPRLSTNVESSEDTKFTASIDGVIMTVTEVTSGIIQGNSKISGIGLSDNTFVQFQSSGSVGGIGTYQITPSQSVSLEVMSAGSVKIAQSTETVIQLDVHGANGEDNAQVISTIMRSGYAVDQMAASGVVPLFSDDPQQSPFQTAADQYEDRWSIDVHLQIIPSVMIPQDFADAITVTTVEVESTYPVN
jgi:hypothetical protein